MMEAAGQMSGLPRPAQRSRIESSCAIDTLAAQNAATTRAGRHSWVVDNLRAEEGSDLAGEGEGVKEDAQGRVGSWGGHMVHLGGAGEALGSKGRGGILVRASAPGYSRAVGLAHGWDGRDGCQRTVGMADEARDVHRQHARAAHEAHLEVHDSWVAVKTRIRREEENEYQGRSVGTRVRRIPFVFIFPAALFVLGEGSSRGGCTG
jgi:hypothetical protein